MITIIPIVYCFFFYLPLVGVLHQLRDGFFFNKRFFVYRGENSVHFFSTSWLQERYRMSVHNPQDQQNVIKKLIRVAKLVFFLFVVTILSWEIYFRTSRTRYKEKIHEKNRGGQKLSRYCPFNSVYRSQSWLTILMTLPCKSVIKSLCQVTGHSW
jgi:hypothetical protein